MGVIIRLVDAVFGKYATVVLWGIVAAGLAALYGWHVWQVKSAYKDGLTQGRATERLEWVRRVQEEQNTRRRAVSPRQSTHQIHRATASAQL